MHTGYHLKVNANIHINIVFVPYPDSAPNMDTPNIFKPNKFYRHMDLRARKEKQLKR